MSDLPKLSPDILKKLKVGLGIVNVLLATQAVQQEKWILAGVFILTAYILLLVK